MAAPKTDLSKNTKRTAIVKANARMVIAVSAASFIAVFCLVASKAVLSQNQYQARVISAQSKANNQLKKNIQAFDNLVGSYKDFDDKDQNVIGGNRTGTGDNDGSNSKIVLDSLPSSYDFPALASSLEKMFNDRSFKVSSITGNDDQLSQQSNASSGAPSVVSIPFSFSVGNATYNSVQDLVSTLQKSIRPIAVDSIDMSGGADNMTITVNAHTFYQPSKSINFKDQVIK